MFQKEKEDSCEDCEDKMSNINDTFLKIIYGYLKYSLFWESSSRNFINT